jgi:hypothetical protein
LVVGCWLLGEVVLVLMRRPASAADSGLRKSYLIR